MFQRQLREADKRNKRDEMTIGRNSMRSSVRAPKFLDKSSGFYSRLEEAGVAGEAEEGEDGGREVGERLRCAEDGGAEGKAEGLMGDDGETLLQRKPSRLSSRWRRSTRRKQKEEQPGGETINQVVIEVVVGGGEEGEQRPSAEPREATLVGDADDQVLIRDTKRGREEEEGEEEWRMKKEQEEGMKMLKRNTAKNYRKVGESRRARALANHLVAQVMLSLNLVNLKASLDCVVTVEGPGGGGSR